LDLGLKQNKLSGLRPLWTEEELSEEDLYLMRECLWGVKIKIGTTDKVANPLGAWFISKLCDNDKELEEALPAPPSLYFFNQHDDCIQAIKPSAHTQEIWKPTICAVLQNRVCI